MWTMEDVLSELRERGEEEEDNYYYYNEKGRNNNKNNSNNNGLPPGFRFHPTDEELITYYLASKVFYNRTVSTPVHIAEVDLNRCEPWDLPERAKMGEKEWYLYSLRDRKYPTGLRTNRATSSGYWKATGKDRQVNAGSGTGDGLSLPGGMLIGMKKTLVFYQGRAPRGVKTRWVMHEYRLDGHFSSFRLSSKEEWVICRIFHKNGGDKKTTFHPPPPPLPPLSPFLRHLPPLLDVPTTTTITTTATSSTSTIQSLEFCNRKPRNSNNNNNNNNNNHYHSDSNFLLQSLLSNPLPNFSSLTDDPTTEFAASSAFTTTTPAAATSIGHHTPPPPFLFNPLSSRASKQNKNMQQQQLMYHHNAFGFSETDNQCHDNENEDDNDDDVAVNFHMSSSSVDALDRLIYPSHHINFAAESWPCH